MNFDTIHEFCIVSRNFVNKYCMDEFCMAFFYLKEVSNFIYFFDFIENDTNYVKLKEYYFLFVETNPFALPSLHNQIQGKLVYFYCSHRKLYHIQTSSFEMKN